MLTITQGPATEQQIFIVYGIVTYLIVAPMVIITAGICGWVARQRLIRAEAEQLAKTEANRDLPRATHPVVEHPHAVADAHRADAVVVA